MKKIFILSLLCISCNTKSKQDNFCVKKIWYHSQKERLIPSVIEIKIEDDKGIIFKKVESGKLKNIILYSIKKEDRYFFNIEPFGVGNQFKKEDNLITFYVFTSFFDTERKPKLTPKEIEKAITGDVGLIFDKDIIVVKSCN
jgi:hypothetical protein